jgi:protease IV
MTYDADLFADRARLRHKLTVWRVVAFAAVILALVGMGALAARRTVATSQAHIAKVAITGFISGSARTLDLIKDVGESKAAAVLVMIDSPGGTTAGAEALFDALRRLAAKKPTVAVVGTMAASGGYIAAIATDRIVARQTALVGSIGVLFQYPNVASLLDHIGVKVEEIKSSPLKAAPNGFEPTSPEARAALESVVVDSYDWFKRIVRERRSMDATELAAVADGRIHTGHQALPLKLVDELGGEREAIAWLEREKGVAKDLPVREWRPRSDSGRLGLWSSAAFLAAALGYDDVATVFGRLAAEVEVTRLDGLVALWHPALEK